MRLMQLLAVAGFSACISVCQAEEEASTEQLQVVRTSDIHWRPLNPKRGARGPQAGTLWGDQTQPGASGFLVKFVDGFSSPPHIHNISYRAIVLGGHLHNDDPEAKPMWMPPGSFWTQPAGEPHITSSRGAGVAYVEIDSGPYLVQPTDEAFDNGERPINVDVSNLVWLDVKKAGWGQEPEGGSDGATAQVALLWGSPKSGKPGGTFLKLPPGFQGMIGPTSGRLRMIVVTGSLRFLDEDNIDTEPLSTGSAVELPSDSRWRLRSGRESDCVIYIRASGEYHIERSDPPILGRPPSS
ncbi:hypothetical protein MalM25_07060 [Planctomycetes bacterium MalM25]|nr:hypothetical protein MalM25_07060 [Planctomycetes bacterium MalM25]